MITTKTTLTLLASLLLIPAAAAQEATIESAKADVEAAKNREKKIQLEERAKALMEKKPVVASGFLVDAARAEKKSSFFKLRSPRDPKTDYRNIAFEERTGRPKGFVLFRLEF
jgi:hypothetical protein